MNIFRLAGDVSHLVAIIILLLKIWKSRSCAGISGKSQVLFALVFTTRYLDLLTVYISAYNTVMKVVFLALSYATVYMIYMRFRNTYDSENDSFRVEFLLVPVIGLSFLENYAFTPVEILWTFSIFLEAVAIMPQLFMITKTGEAESITTHYLFFLGLYRALYIANWIWRYHTEGFFDQIAVVSGVVQTIFYCDFFYLYVTKEGVIDMRINQSERRMLRSQQKQTWLLTRKKEKKLHKGLRNSVDYYRINIRSAKLLLISVLRGKGKMSLPMPV